MLKLLQQCQMIMPWTEHNQVLLAYNALLINPVPTVPSNTSSIEKILFRGAQPETLHLHDLSR